MTILRRESGLMAATELRGLGESTISRGVARPATVKVSAIAENTQKIKMYTAFSKRVTHGAEIGRSSARESIKVSRDQRGRCRHCRAGGMSKAIWCCLMHHFGDFFKRWLASVLALYLKRCNQVSALAFYSTGTSQRIGKER